MLEVPVGNGDHNVVGTIFILLNPERISTMGIGDVIVVPLTPDNFPVFAWKLVFQSHVVLVFAS
jgi:hypothetical protein